MPQDLTKEQVNFGEVVYSWSFKEYEKHERSSRWYWLASILGLALVAYAFISQNYLFGIIIVLFSIIIFLQDKNEPIEIPFAIVETGIIVGNKYYRFSELKDFWVIYNPPEVKVLYFGLKDVFKHRLHIPLGDIDPRLVHKYLSRFVTENLEEEDEPFSDKMGRLLKLH
ncbi:MAG TPA: hypothetical protein P5230_02970 [Candidatus Magasanikbacteria bacterium]|nr:hypothetical protein [Candidatus Magasanikbacteria bacterium]